MSDVFRELKAIDFGQNLAESLAKIGQTINEHRRRQEADKAVTGILSSLSSGKDILSPEVGNLFSQLTGTPEGQQSLGTLGSQIQLKREQEQMRLREFGVEALNYEKSMQQYEQDRRSAVEDSVLEQQNKNLQGMYNTLINKYPERKGSISPPSPATAIKQQKGISATEFKYLPPKVKHELLKRDLKSQGIEVTDADLEKSIENDFGDAHQVTTWKTNKKGELQLITATTRPGKKSLITVEPVVTTDEKGAKTPLVTKTATIPNLLATIRMYENDAIFNPQDSSLVAKKSAYEQMLRQEISNTYSLDPSEILNELVYNKGMSQEEAVQYIQKYGLDKFAQPQQ